MAVITFKDNSAEFLQALNAANGRILTMAGDMIRTDAVKNSPKRTGALQGSWIVEVDTDAQTVTIGVPLNALERNYAKYIEAGTKTKKGATKIPAHHMLQNAVNANMGKFQGLALTEYKNA